jgi:NADH-quinone oxidoreductase subunit L
MVDNALLGIVLFPLLGAIANGVFGSKAGRAAVNAVAVAAVAAAFGLALWSFTQLLSLRVSGEEHAVLHYTAYEWFSLTTNGHTLSIPVRFAMDELSGIMTLVVTGIGLLIHIYSVGYMSEEPSYARFFAYLNLFTASMLILVLGSNLPLMFVGWEGVGLCSYLLIGFWFENADYASAGRKAFIANRIGDFGVLIGMFLLAIATHSLEFADINAFALQHPEALTADLAFGPQLFVWPGVSLVTVAALCLFLGCTGKSAQLPLYVWLPDAMAGPTPVSALIHAATMVTSGIYLVCRLSPVFVLSPHTMAVITLIGALTAVLAASVALVQTDIKKVLAFSTVSQLGFMFAAVGAGAFAAGFFHVFTHAFFKACLFLGAGSVMHAVDAHGDADIRTLGGLRRYMPTTHWTFLVSCLAIAGVPLFSGFFSKDEILVGVLSAREYFSFAPWIVPSVFALLVVGATMTAFYMFRLYFLTFGGEFRGGPAHALERAHAAAAISSGQHPVGSHTAGYTPAADEQLPHESPISMTLPLSVLGFGAVVAGYVWIGVAHFEPWVHWLAPVLATITGSAPEATAAAAVHAGGVAPVAHEAASAVNTGVALGSGLVAAALGIGIAFTLYAKPSTIPDRLAKAFPGLHQLLLDKWRVDELYDATVLGASRLLALLLSVFDRSVVDGILTQLTTHVVGAVGFVFTRFQNGLVQAYGSVMALGLLAMVFHFIVPHPDPRLVGEPLSMTATLAASQGLSYQYRWDFSDDGQYDTDWSDSALAEHAFKEEELSGFGVVFESAAYGVSPRTLMLLPKGEIPVTAGRLSGLVRGDSISAHEFGPNWRVSVEDPALPLPTIHADEQGLVIRPNGARVRLIDKDGKLSGAGADAEVHVARGEQAILGSARLSVTGVARARLLVRNVFGMERSGTVDVILPKVAPRIAAQVARSVSSAKGVL